MGRNHGERFVVLDSFRGLCAIGVALAHCIIVSHIAGAPLVIHAGLYVDFFFVLSGFVISHAYFTKLTTTAFASKYIVRRFGRLWPLHVATLLVLVLWSLMKAGLTRVLHLPSLPWDMFRDPQLTFGSIFANILLVHGLGFSGMFTQMAAWNAPSWSISVEFYTCLIFAALCALGSRNASWLVAIAGVLSATMLLLAINGNIWEASAQLFRGIYGFMIGHAIWRLSKNRTMSYPFATALEVITIIAVLCYVEMVDSGPITALAPIVFGPAIWVFSGGRGAISNVLGLRPFVRIGTLSYSIYMTHYVILTIGLTCIKAIDKVLHTQVASERYLPGGELVAFMDFGNKWRGDLADVFYIVVVIAISSFTFRYIEMPARELIYRKRSVGRSPDR